MGCPGTGNTLLASGVGVNPPTTSMKPIKLGPVCATTEGDSIPTHSAATKPSLRISITVAGDVDEKNP